MRVDAWLARVRAQEGASTAVPLPSFFFVSGWFDSTASCAIKLARHLRYVHMYACTTA